MVQCFKHPGPVVLEDQSLAVGINYRQLCRAMPNGSISLPQKYEDTSFRLSRRADRHRPTHAVFKGDNRFNIQEVIRFDTVSDINFLPKISLIIELFHLQS